MSCGEVWAYDGSLECLVALAERAFEEGRCPSSLAIPAGSGRELGLFDELCEASPAYALSGGAPACERSASVAEQWLRRRSPELFDQCLRAWMSEENVERELLAAAALAGRSGSAILEDYSIPEIRVLDGACRRVCREIHRLQGLARFTPRDDGLYSAPLRPDHNVLAALLPHFTRRFGPQAFALVDLRRELAYASRGEGLEAFVGARALDLLPSRLEDEDSALWRRYFEATENPARRNPSLQRRLMPARYWDLLPELAARERPSRQPRHRP